MTTHYTGLGETTTACGLPCRTPTEDERARVLPIAVRIEPRISNGVLWFARTATRADEATLDPRHVDCPECIAELPDVPACQCGAPALYGVRSDHEDYCDGYACAACSSKAQWCEEHAPDDCRCTQCRKPLLDASESYCAACLDPDVGDGITVEPARYGCGVAS